MNTLKPIKFEVIPFIPVPDVKESNSNQAWREFERATYQLENALQPVTEFTDFVDSANPSLV